ncbi:hypothetical protein QBC34DRAFT_434261 [Podospora aff. communis PSN243]|uniref:Uncharacterized protein n=1 Tax=Podospora aff. communis PSN243 TaxID=3040156 RepID=A0AAV9H226_9PEZI|nr:hypothetical protein QBC34DRAFT_434261 [Podospora aff. communis PSN243]
MSKRQAEWEIIPHTQCANLCDLEPSDLAFSSTPPDEVTGETSNYWDDTVPDSFPSGEHHKLTYRGPPELKRRRRRSTSTLEAEPPGSSTPLQQIPRQFRVTKSLGHGDFAERRKPATVDSATSQNQSPLFIPALTWSSQSTARHSSTPYGDQPETPVAPQSCPGTVGFSGGNLFPDRHHGDATNNLFAPLGPEPTVSPLPRDFTTPLRPSRWPKALPFDAQPPILEEDNYSIGASDEEELAKLVDSVSANPTHPPLSVIRSMDSGTSHEPVFDPNLPGSPPIKTENRPTTANPEAEEEDLLDAEVDWDMIIELLPSLPHDPSLSMSPREAVPRYLPTPEVQTSQSIPQRKPFVRSPFPTPLRDKSPVTGLSRSSILRTCFRIGQILNETKKCFDSHQDVVFELYARVTYSSREKMARVQHFQFMDLCNDHPPYLTGKLNGWKTGSLVDEHSLAFLGSGEGQKAKLCRCICKPVKEKKRDLGWSFSVLAIRQVDWEEIDMMKQML